FRLLSSVLRLLSSVLRLLNSAELFEKCVARADRLRGGHVDEREALDVAETEGLQPEDHVGEVGALDLGLRETRTFEVVLLAVQPDADALGNSTGAALALVGARLRNRLDRQAARARLRGIPADPR